jgi:hypothetical protein
LYILVGSDKVQSELLALTMRKRVDVDYKDLKLSDILMEIDRVFEGDQLDTYLKEIKGL